MKKILIKITEQDIIGLRIDKFIFDKISEEDKNYYSRTRIQDIIKNGNLEKNGEIFNTISYKTRLGDEFALILPDPEETEIKEKNIKLDILFEDEHLLVVNKQAGLITHPGAGNKEDTLVNALLYHCKGNLSGVGGVLRPGIVHRLDKDTSGLMVVAKDDLSHHLLSEQIKTRVFERHYNAVIWGTLFPKYGKIEGYIDRSKCNRLKMEMTKFTGKFSCTNYSVIKEFGDIASLIDCKLDTGRTHQIRVHFSNKKHPLIGDQLYGFKGKKLKTGTLDNQEIIENFSRQALHSKTINFFHPITGENMYFESELPDDIKSLLDVLSHI